METCHSSQGLNSYQADISLRRIIIAERATLYTTLSTSYPEDKDAFKPDCQSEYRTITPLVTTALVATALVTTAMTNIPLVTVDIA